MWVAVLNLAKLSGKKIDDRTSPLRVYRSLKPYYQPAAVSPACIEARGWILLAERIDCFSEQFYADVARDKFVLCMKIAPRDHDARAPREWGEKETPPNSTIYHHEEQPPESSLLRPHATNLHR